MPLPEQEPIEDIVAWFAGQGFDLELHQDAPDRPEARTVSRTVRDASEFSHWCGVGRSGWYGGGASDDNAIRSARSRWRIEQEGSEPSPRRRPWLSLSRGGAAPLSGVLGQVDLAVPKQANHPPNGREHPSHRDHQQGAGTCNNK